MKDASAGQVGCKPSEIEITDDDTGWSTRTWTATCRGRSYSCAYVQTGGSYGSGSSGTSGQVNCSPMSTSSRNPTAPAEEPVMMTMPRASAATSGGSTPAHVAKTERAFDEKRGVHIVRGTFRLTPTLQLRLLGIPQMALGKVAAVLTGRSKDAALQECGAVEVLVNEEPVGSQENTRRTESGEINVESRFDFEVFKPLGQQYSTFGARACGQKWKLQEPQMAEVKKFFVIYSQIGEQVQNGELEKKAAPPEGAEAAGN